MGQCSYDYKGGCSAAGASFTDFNMWDRALTEQEQIDWTTCANMQQVTMLYV